MNKPQSVPKEEAISTADRLLDVATTAFARKGYYGTSIRDLAREVHLSVATLYYYAKNKDDLYLMVFERQYKEEAKLIIDILATADETTTHNPDRTAQVALSVDGCADRPLHRQPGYRALMDATLA